MRAYYNEIDPFAAQWLRNLIAAGRIMDGDVDERSIVDVRAEDLRGLVQVLQVSSASGRVGHGMSGRESTPFSATCSYVSSAIVRTNSLTLIVPQSAVGSLVISASVLSTCRSCFR